MVTFQKEKNKDFVVLNLTDVQLCECQWDENDPKYDNAYAIMNYTVKTLIERVKPDLITVTGDISSADQKKAYPAFSKYIEQYRIPWALTWGNHDQQDGMEFLDDILKIYRKGQYFVHEDGDPTMGNGNYVIAIMQDGKPVHALFMVDSHNCTHLPDENGEPTVFAYDKLNEAQLAWYKDQVEALRQDGCKHSSMLMHIPIYAYREAFEAAFQSDIDPKTVTMEQSLKGDCWKEGYKDSYGVGHEVIGSYPYDDGVFTVVKELGHTENIVSGHDHTNNWVIKYQGVNLIYATKTGKGCYWEPESNGGTVIQIHHDGSSTVRHEMVDVTHLL